MTVVLHIGTHKTGTTAIQRFAAANRARLRARGLWYPSYDEIKLFVHYGHHHVAHAIANEKGNRLSLAETRRFLDHVVAHKRPRETLLISAEPFYRHVLPAEGGHWAERKAYIDRLRSLIPTEDVKVLCIVRRQDTFARSLYQERIKVTKYRESFQDFIADRHPFEYYEQLELFRDVFGTVEVLVYEELTASGLIDSFFGKLGIDVSGIKGRPAANASLPIDLVAFKRIVNGTSLTSDRLKEIGVLLLDKADKASRIERGKVDWLPVAEMAAFYASFAESNERLRREYLPGREGPLFPEFEMPTGDGVPAVYPGMSAAQFATIAAELLLLMEQVAMRAAPDVAFDAVSEEADQRFRRGKSVAFVIRLLADRSGGAERIYVELANMLAARGYEVTCLHYEHGRGKPFFALDRRVELINLHPDPVPRRYRLRRWASRRGFIPRSLRQRWGWAAANDIFIRQLRDYYTFRRPDIVLSFMPPANTPALLAAEGTDIKVVPTNHNVPTEDYTSIERWDPNPIDRAARLAALDHAARIHVIFPRFGEWFPAHLQSRIVAMPNYVSDEILTARPAPNRERAILAVGRLATVKNYDTLLAAWALIAADHPEWKVVIYGVGPQLNHLKAEALRLGVGDSFHLEGHRGNLGEEYARMSIFCHPAHFEGFGLAAAGALALGTPVVAFADCPGVSEFVVDGENGLLVDRNGGAKGLAAALERLMEDEALRERLGAAGPATVARFTQKQYAARWIALIEELTEAAESANGDA